MSAKQRELFAKGAVELANIVVGALVFGQFLAGKPINISVFGIGTLLSCVFYLVAYKFSQEHHG